MSQLLYRPSVLARALYVGSYAARKAATATDPDAGGVGLALQPDGSLRIYSENGQNFSRAYADPAARVDSGTDAPIAALSLHGTSTLQAGLEGLRDTQEPVELRFDAVGVRLVRDHCIIFASASNKADTLAPLEALAGRPRERTDEIPPALQGYRTGLHLELCTGSPALDPEDALDTWGVQGRDDLIDWHLGDWALGRLHADAATLRR